MTEAAADVSVSALQRRDPRSLGGVDLIGRLTATETGVVYAGRFQGRPVAVVMLLAGAESDTYARARFERSKNQLAATVVAADADVDISPWAALRADSGDEGLAAACGMLAAVTLEHVPPVGAHAGPQFRPHWAARREVGRWRIWPLPWPASLTSASRWTYVAAFALVLAIAALALLIAVRLFENQAPAPPGPGPGPVPLPTQGSPSPSPTEPSPSGSHRPAPTPLTGIPTAPPIV